MQAISCALRRSLQSKMTVLTLIRHETSACECWLGVGKVPSMLKWMGILSCNTAKPREHGVHGSQPGAI